MKLLVISSMWPSKEKQNYGIFVKNFVEELKRKNVNVEVVANSNPRTGILNALRKYFALFMKVVFYRKVPEIVQAEFVFPSGLIMRVLPRFRKSRRVLVFHGSDAYLWKRLPLGKVIYQKIIQFSDAVVFPSEFLKNEAVAFFPYLSEKKIRVIPRGISECFLSPYDKREARKKLGIPENKFLVLSVGNLIKIKDHLTILKAAKLLKIENLVVAIVGEGYLRYELERFDRGGKFTLLLPGSVNEEEMVLWYASADIFVTCSLRESYGIALREAMAMGLPIVASDIPPHREAIRDGENGLLFKTSDAEDLAGKISYFYENPHFAEVFGKRAMLAKTIITMKDTAKEYIKLYNELLSINGRSDK